MYYSKNGGIALNVPKNYSGNAFRNDPYDECGPPLDAPCEKETEKQSNEPRDLISSLFSGISAEDILLLGLIFIIHQENPNDNTLLLLLILLLAK